MIHINLAPPTEIKDKLWFIPELALFLFILAVSWTGVQLFLGHIEDQTTTLRNEIEDIGKNIAKLHPDVEKFEQMTNQIQILKDKIRAVQKITVSKTARYLPVILLEHLQAFKPEGLWFNSVEQDARSSQIRVSGGAFDGLLIAEFMASLENTKKQAPTVNDVKSFIYFTRVDLDHVSSEGSGAGGSGGSGGGSDSADSAEAKKAFKKTKDIKAFKGSGGGGDSNRSFPELGSFPSFSLTIQYAEHGDEAAPVTGKGKHGIR